MGDFNQPGAHSVFENRSLLAPRLPEAGLDQEVRKNPALLCKLREDLTSVLSTLGTAEFACKAYQLCVSVDGCHNLFCKLSQHRKEFLPKIHNGLSRFGFNLGFRLRFSFGYKPLV